MIDAPPEAVKLFSGAASEAERLPRVTLLAVREVVAAERALAVVARHATLAAARAEVLRRLRRGDLPRLRRTGANLMALLATQPLTRAVRRVVETDGVSL